MQPQTRRSLDGLLVIGPHGLDDQLRALTEYAGRTEHVLDVFWALLPGEDPALDAPDSGFPIVAFDDEIAGFTAEEHAGHGPADDLRGGTTMDWHVAHAAPQPKRPTSHLPVYGCATERETGADAILCVGPMALDGQIALIEAFAIRSSLRLRGVYIANDAENLRVLVRDFSASDRTLRTGPTLTVGPRGEIEVHG